jgi:heptosyltransferase-3
MNSLRDIVDTSPQLRGIESTAVRSAQGEDGPQPLAPAQWDWSEVRKVLLIRLRSIGDTVLSTPSILALKRFLPNAEIDILVEDWVAPLLDNHPLINKVVVMKRGGLPTRLRTAIELRQTGYDVVYNLHGGTTATLLTRATGAKYRVGFGTYQYSQLYNYQSPSPLLLWGQNKTHSVEQQLALLGWTGVPVTDRPRTQLGISPDAAATVEKSLSEAGLTDRKIALIHPAAAFATKRWSIENFAKVAEHLVERGFAPVAIAAPNERELLDELQSLSAVQLFTFDFALPEVTALAARAKLFVGNDSGIAHIAAAVDTPSVVIFGSSNIAHWRPWTRMSSEVVFEQLPCQPCHGYFCEKFPEPECILRIPVSRVTAAIDRLITVTN